MKTDKVQPQSSTPVTDNPKNDELSKQVAKEPESSSAISPVINKDVTNLSSKETCPNSTLSVQFGSSYESKNKVLNKPFLRDDKPNNDASSNESFIELFYNKIVSVLGGANQNQFLTLMLPGQSLRKEDFSFDLKTEEKPPIIEERESNLANKLYDACTMTGADNGMTLQYQYQSALDTLSPKLNAKMIELKNACRDLLQSEYYYDFGDGQGTQKSTLKDVFFRLYDDYVNAFQKWAQEQNDQRKHIRDSQISASDGDKESQVENEYQRWYSITAPAKFQLLDEKYAKVLAVFSPTDLKILEGLLDSGTGAEIQRCRDNLRNFQKLTPYGGSYYPVNLQPSNWFDFLETNFTPVDLLDSSRAIRQRITDLKHQQDSLVSQISNLTALIPDDESLESLRKSIEEANKKVSEARAQLITAQGEGAGEVLDAVAVMIKDYKTKKNSSPDTSQLDSMINAAVQPEKNAQKESAQPSGEGGGSSGEGGEDKVSKLISDVGHLLKDQGQLAAVIDGLTDSTAALSNNLSKYINDNNLTQFKPTLDRLQNQLKTVEQDIAEATTDLSIAIHKENAVKATSNAADVSSLATQVPKGFTQVLIDAQASSLNQSSKQSTSSRVSTSGTSFFFFGHSHTDQKASASFEAATSENNSKIQIAMNVAKIGIERPWFNPGVFALTKDMFRLGNQLISSKSTENSFTDNRFKDMNSCIFPCYPVALLVARDVSIRFSCSENSSQQLASSAESHSRTGGGFLLFAGSKSSDSSDKSSSSHVSSSSNSVTIRFDTPQVIGVYQEVVRPDLSTPIQNINDNDEYVSILNFIHLYKESLEKMQKIHQNLKQSIS